MKHHFFSAIGRLLFFSVIYCLMSFNHASAQSIIGRQNVDQYPITSWGSLTYGLTWLPTDYYTNTSQKYPLIIFLHGSGEGGDGVSGLYNLITQGLPMTIANGFNPEAVNPADGQNYKFIVVSPQAPSAAQWSYSYGSVQYILPDVLRRYRVDPSRVYITGLSAGGAGTWSCVTNGPDFASKIAAIVPVSSAGTNTQAESDQIPLVGGTYGVKVWSTAGALESWLAFAQDATNRVNNASPAPQVPALLSVIPNVGHEPAGWNAPYYPTWRDNGVGLNIFEWMLKYTRNIAYTPPANQAPTASAGADQTITLPTSTATLSGSGSDPDGTISSYQWSQLSGPSVSFSANSAQTTISGLVQGTYSFRLTVKDNSGATAYDDVNLTVNPAPTISTTSSSSLHLEAENYSSMYGIQTENTSDAGGGLNVGWQDNNDWMDYNVNLSASGTYTLNFRVATMFSGPQFQVRNSSGTVLATVNVPNTGGFQNWQNVSAQVSLPSGQQTLRIFTSNAAGGWNINWWELQAVTTSNQSPTVSAGVPQSLVLPTNACTLSGNATDPDGSITSYQWSEITGPSNASISSGNSVQTSIGSLVEGSYLFRLTVKDNAGATASADVTVTVTSSTTTTSTTTTTRIQAENYSAMYGIQTENTSDDGGGLNVGWQDTGDWMDYSVNVPTSGTYTMNFRVSTMFNGPQFQVRNASGTVLKTIDVPNTGWFQTWQTVSADVTLAAGQQTLRIYTSNAAGGWNINWFEIQASTSVAPSTSSIHIEAENFSIMNGIQTENTADAGGGLNVGWQDNNDWMDYPVNISTSGSYTVNFRVATMFTGPQFQLRDASGTVLTTVSVPNTGGFQSWQTVSAQVSLSAGQQTLRIYTNNASGGWNINWWEIQGPSGTTRTAGNTDEIITETGSSSLDVFPNPVRERFALKVNNKLTGKMTVQLYDMGGSLKKTFIISKTAGGVMQTYLSIPNLPAGEYMLKASMTNWSQTGRIIKQ